jgi:hypothetical protein
MRRDIIACRPDSRDRAGERMMPKETRAEWLERRANNKLIMMTVDPEFLAHKVRQFMEELRHPAKFMLHSFDEMLGKAKDIDRLRPEFRAENQDTAPAIASVLLQIYEFDPELERALVFTAVTNEVDAALVSATETPSDTNGVNAGKSASPLNSNSPRTGIFPVRSPCLDLAPALDIGEDRARLLRTRCAIVVAKETQGPDHGLNTLRNLGNSVISRIGG